MPAYLVENTIEHDTAPPVSDLLDARDYTGAITLIEFERKLFFNQKNASGWRPKPDGREGFDWVEGGGSNTMSEEEQQKDEER